MTRQEEDQVGRKNEKLSPSRPSNGLDDSNRKALFLPRILGKNGDVAYTLGVLHASTYMGRV